ncbi:MAG: hypothetical protein ABI559_09600 [Chloroflexota bacterium]
MRANAARALPAGRSAIAESVIERRNVIAICVALFLFTFLIYWGLGARSTTYPHQVSQANNLLHGHLDFLPQYTVHPENLERSMFDGTSYCYAPGDPQIPTVPNVRVTSDCKTYMQYSFGPVFVALPGVAVFGMDFNQTLLSVLIGALTAPIVFLIAGKFSSKRGTQLLLTALMMFGTIFWFAASNGGVWYFAHTTATFFIFAAIYFAISKPNPVFAGAMLGAAFLCRPTMLATGLFFVVSFIPLWLKRPEDNGGRWGVNLQPIVGFAAGLAPFLAIEGVVNYLRFSSPLETGYGYMEPANQDFQQPLFPHGIFDVRYTAKHAAVMLEAMPVFGGSPPDCGSCAAVVPSNNGMAIWATTPAFLLAMFTGVNHRRVSRIGAGLVAAACAFILFRAISQAWESDLATTSLPLGVQLLPFWLMIGAAVFFSLRNRDLLIAACWAAIIPTGLIIFFFAATGWAQFGYRYGLDFTPFLWLLVAKHIGDKLKPWHVALILAAIAVNFMGVMWIYHFDPNHVGGLDWVAMGDRFG